MDYLAQKGVAILIAEGFGPPMIEAMKRKGMRYFQYSGIAQDAVERAVNYLKPAEKGRQGSYFLNPPLPLALFGIAS